MPTVSVVIPTRDRRERLRLALRSALEQRDVDLEVVVIDDGSSDGSSAMVETVADPRVRLVRNDVAQGESAARNRGIAEATSPWIAFLDDDDLWAPEKLSRQLAALVESGRSWAYGGEVLVDEGLHVLGGSPPPPPEQVAADLSRYNAVPGSASNVIVASDALARVGPFDVGLRRTPDWDMWLRLRREGLPAAVDRPTVALSVHPGNASRDMSTLFGELDLLAARHGIVVDRARHLRWAAWTSLVEGRRLDAARGYVRAAGSGDPSSVLRALVALLPAPPEVLARARKPPGGRDEAWVDQARAWLAALRADRP